MAYDIVIGRNNLDKALLGSNATIFLGKHYIQMGQTTSMSNRILLDVARSHIILVTGKRGSGKSYSLSVIAEEMTKLPEEVSRNLSVIIFDTMGIFWTMKHPNHRQEDLLKAWNLKPDSFDINVFGPKGLLKQLKQREVDKEFSIKPNELNAADWVNTFEIELTSEQGVLIERTINELEGNYGIEDIIKSIKNDYKAKKEIKDSVENRFSAAKNWGLFDKKGTNINSLVQRGNVTIIDLSPYSNIAGNWSIKALVIGLISRKLLQDRIAARRLEELKAIKESKTLFQEEEKHEMPLVWLMIDEAHEFLPRIGSTVATDALIQVLREGRQPGISVVLATQQPGEIARDVITQSDIVISHRLTAKADVEALNSMMQSYLVADIQKYLNELPKLKGSALILDDNSERIYPMAVRPKLSWHGGEAPTAYRPKKTLLVR